MKSVLLLFSLLMGSVAFASQNLNHIGCVYVKDSQGWQFWQVFSSGNSFDLSTGQKNFLTGMWTSEKPVLPNYAVCTTMVGTDDKDSVAVESYRYKADEFDPMTANDSCSVAGKNVELIAKDSTNVKKGSFAQVEIDWVPPYADKIQIKEYVPLDSELDKIGEIASDKCLELMPN
jgi:hypothetical protein